MISHNLKLFIMVAERGSITQAANDLYISQPAISKAIKSLEKELNVKLFYRNRRQGLVLTEAGKHILLYARKMEKLENQIYQIAFQENHCMGGKLRIAAFPIITSTILSKVIYRFRKQYPLVEVELTDRDPQSAQKLAETHAVDFAISASPFTNVDHETLFKDHIVAIYLQEGDVRPPVNLYRNTDSLIYCEAGIQTIVDILKDAHNINFHNNLTVSNHETVIHMVEQGNGAGIISEYTLDSIPNTLHRCPVQPTIEIDVALVAADLSDLTPIAREFIRMLKETIQDDREQGVKS